MSKYDLIVIGAGPGGYVGAIRAAQLGKKTALIENRQVGGTCLNRGCIPTKTLMHSAELLEQIKKSSVLGINVEHCSVDMEKLRDRENKVVAYMRDGIQRLLKGNKIDLIYGKGTIVGAHTVRVGTDLYEADNILIATGSVPLRPPIPGLDLPGVVTSDEILAELSAYESLVIIGGGVIGVEMATIFCSLGCQVTIVEALDRILAAMDREIAQNLSLLMKKRGIKIYTGAAVSRIEAAEAGLAVKFMVKGREETAKAQGVLAAVGRKPLTEDLFDGVDVDMQQGFIAVDQQFCTSIKNIYAVGDVIGGTQLAHKAEAEGKAAAEGICGLKPTVNTACVPACVYTTPEIASVGITADAARRAGFAIKTGKYIMNGNGKTVISQGERGFIKLVFDEKTEVLLGAQLMCERATDLISELTTAIVHGLTRSQLVAVIRPHPTFAEAVTEAAEAADGMAIHMLAGKN